MYVQQKERFSHIDQSLEHLEQHDQQHGFDHQLDYPTTQRKMFTYRTYHTYAQDPKCQKKTC